MRKALTIILCIFFASVAIYAGYQIYAELSEYQAGDETYEQLTQFVTFAEKEEAETDTDVEQTVGSQAFSQETEETETDGIQWPIVDFAALSKINSDVVGWIYMEGTNVNYPIVQTGDNSYYLTHMFDGTKNKTGSIFMDCGNLPDFSDPNTVIHGHHMKDKSMFADITKYKEQEFYDQYPTYLLMTPDGNYLVEIVAGYVASQSADAWQLDFSTEEKFQTWIDQTMKKSCFTSNVTPTVEDRFITLSTCSYEFEDARFVLVGVLR